MTHLASGSILPVSLPARLRRREIVLWPKPSDLEYVICSIPFESKSIPIAELTVLPRIRT